MLESILSGAIAQLPVAIVAAVVLIIEGMDARKSKIPCKTCRYLKTEGCGNWKYVGTEGVCPFTRFDKPPKYCSSYAPRDKSEDANV